MADQSREMIRLKDVEFRYPGAAAASLLGVSFSVRAGEMLLISGPTGCGKTTLLKVISGIIPLESSGSLKGMSRVCGLETCNATLSDLARRVGLVFQSPDDQLCATTVSDEVAFGPRNLGMLDMEVQRRLKLALRQVGLSGLKDAHTARLSGGQKQRVAIAAQLAMLPSVLALDEPISQLDPQGASEVLCCLKELSSQGLTVVIVEHRLGDCLPLASRLLLMDQGRVRLDIPQSEVGTHLSDLDELGLKVPDELKARTYWPGCDNGGLSSALSGLRPDPPRLKAPGPVLIRLDKASYTYSETGQPALKECSLEIRQGEVLAVVGPNGSGKSTLLGILAGLQRPQSGELYWRDKPVKKRLPAGKVGLLLQNPDLLLLETSLGRELMSGPRLLKKTISQERSRLLATEIGLAAFWDIPPWALSKGQRLRAALGAILATKPELLLLDEPTTGQNQANLHRLLAALVRRRGLRSVVICSHDMETVARFSDRLAVLHEGCLVNIGPTRDVLAQMGQDSVAGLKPHWPLRMSFKLGIDPPFLTLEEMAAAAGFEPPELSVKQEGPAPCASV